MTPFCFYKIYFEQNIAIHTSARTTDSIKAIITGGIIKVKNTPTTKPSTHSIHTFFIIFLKNNTHTSPDVITLSYESMGVFVTNRVLLFQYRVRNIFLFSEEVRHVFRFLLSLRFRAP